MIALMTRPMVTPFRWEGFRLDIRGIVTERGPFFLARDICAVLEIEVPYESEPNVWPERLIYRYPGTTLTMETHGGYAEDSTDDVYEADEVVRVANNNITWFTGDFLQWFVQLLEQLDPEDGLGPSAFVDPEPGVKDLGAGRTFSVARAARKLSRDPAISLGMKSLFESMREHGWISRDHEIWIPSPDQLRAGHLVRHKQRVPGHKEIYPQIRITHAGMEELHRILGGQAALRLDETPDLTLVDIS